MLCVGAPSRAEISGIGIEMETVARQSSAREPSHAKDYLPAKHPRRAKRQTNNAAHSTDAGLEEIPFQAANQSGHGKTAGNTGGIGSGRELENSAGKRVPAEHEQSAGFVFQRNDRCTLETDEARHS